jgi:hypothetical protein
LVAASDSKAAMDVLQKPVLLGLKTVLDLV